MTEWVLRGVPGALAMDAWWLGDTTPPPKGDRSEAKLAPARGVLALLALVGIGDVLFFRHAVGLSLAILAGAAFLAVLLPPSPPARGFTRRFCCFCRAFPSSNICKPCRWDFWLSG